jgi:hypothetical protein
MNKLIIEHHIAWLRNASEKAGIGIEARIKQQTCRRTMEIGDFSFQQLGILGIAIQETRASTPDAQGSIGSRGEFRMEGTLQQDGGG